MSLLLTASSATPATRHPDITAPTLELEGPNTLSIIAAVGASGSWVDFPTLKSKDIGAVPAPNITCQGNFAPLGSLAYTAGAKATFPVGNTQVVCTARDAATNPSKPVTFTVAVECPLGFNLSSSICKGEWNKHTGCCSKCTAVEWPHTVFGI